MKPTVVALLVILRPRNVTEWNSREDRRDGEP